jgi:hypothetical protein
MFRTMLTKKCIEPLAAPGGTIDTQLEELWFLMVVNGGYNYYYGY